MTTPISVFKTPSGETRSRNAYDLVLRSWPVAYEELFVNTHFGLTHIIACGPGNGQPLILLHGQEASATMWFYNIRDLSQTFRVFMVDTVGDIGKSQPTCLPENRAEYAAWLLDILDQLQLDKVDLLGISYGGFLALNFVIAHPERVNRVVLLAPGIPNFGPPTFQWASYGFPMLMAPSQITIRRFLSAASQKGYSAQDLVHEQMLVAVPQLRNRNFMRPVFLDEELRQINAPCLLMVGEQEIMYNPIKALERARQLIPNLITAMIGDAGHFLNSDQPEIVYALALIFIKEKEIEGKPR